MNHDGSNQVIYKRITTRLVKIWHVWSPNGTRSLLERSRWACGNLHQDRRGTNVVRRTNQTSLKAASGSPDGTKLVFHSVCRDGSARRISHTMNRWRQANAHFLINIMGAFSNGSLLATFPYNPYTLTTYYTSTILASENLHYRLHRTVTKSSVVDGTSRNVSPYVRAAYTQRHGTTALCTCQLGSAMLLPEQPRACSNTGNLSFVIGFLSFTE